MKTTVIEFIEIGALFRIAGTELLYVKEDYNTTLKKYSAYQFDDVNAYRYLKKGTIVETGFDFLYNPALPAPYIFLQF